MRRWDRIVDAETWRRAWPHVCGFLVALHVFAVGIMALPAPGGAMKRSAWADPTVQAEFDAWRARLAVVGLALEPEAFEDGLWAFASSFSDGRERVLAPFLPYYRHFGTWQSWRMFVAPHTHPTRLHVDVRVDGVWRPVFVERSAEHDWLRRELDHERLRSAVFRYGWKAYGRGRRELADWMAVRARVDFPEAERLRLRFHKAPTPSPQQILSGDVPEGRWVFETRRDLIPPEPSTEDAP